MTIFYHEPFNYSILNNNTLRKHIIELLMFGLI